MPITKSHRQPPQFGSQSIDSTHLMMHITERKKRSEDSMGGGFGEAKGDGQFGQTRGPAAIREGLQQIECFDKRAGFHYSEHIVPLCGTQGTKMGVDLNSTSAGSPVPRSALPFSPSVSAGGFVFVSGQASVDGRGGIVNDSFEGEMRRSIGNVAAILHANGMALRDVVRVRSYVGRQEDLAEYNRVYCEFFTPPYPARTTLIGVLGSLLKFEIDVTAYPGGPERRPD